MLRSLILAVVLVGLATAGISGQVVVNVGPQVAPLGCNILVNISNDSSSPFLYGSVGPITVLDTSGTPVFFTQLFLFVAVTVPIGTVNQYFNWDQKDNLGNQVPAGSYTMDVGLNGTTTTYPLAIGGIDAAISSIGVHRPGTTRSLYLCSPQDPNGTYIMAASFTSNTGIPTCGGLIPLDVDFLFALSTTANNGIFLNTVGTMDGLNTQFPAATTAPAIAVPNAPISGLTFNVAFIIFDPLQACPIVRLSVPQSITIL